MSDRLLSRLVLSFTWLVAASSARAEPLRFDRDIRPILSDKCFFCHGPDREHREADLRLDLEEEAKLAIVPGDADASDLITRIVSADPADVMPPPDAHKELTAEEKEMLVRWVKEGANWTQHWSFIPPTMPKRPQVRNRDWARVPIDEYILARLEAAGLNPRPEASREKLIRRLTYDLTGLPPTLSEIDAFVNDPSASAYERLVDRLLQSHHYGERMTLMWLDAARYGDTSVYHADGPRDMWAWRDAVIEAYNNNMPFDRFSLYQLAGDLVPETTLQQKILAGFNRNNGTTDEGGAIAEEYRVEYTVDRVKTTSTVWMGLTMECAQCHDHKYDPISQEEYYKLYAFFNVSSDQGMQTRKGNATPTIEVPGSRKTKEAADRTVAACRGKTAAWKSEVEESKPAFEKWLVSAAVGQNRKQNRLQPSDPLLHVPLWEGKDKAVSDLVDVASQRQDQRQSRVGEVAIRLGA